MNSTSRASRSARNALRLWLTLRRLLPKQRSRTFDGRGASDQEPRVGKVYVINLDRERGRWSDMARELTQVLDVSADPLLNLTERYAAIDARAFQDEPHKDGDVDPFYTLGDQLFVEPQPSVLPTNFDLTAPIRMSRAEVAVARSHISVWRHVATGTQPYALVLEDDVWFHSSFARRLDQAWDDISSDTDAPDRFDLLYLSYLEAKHGAPKDILTKNLFRPVRGLWHLSGYVLSRSGAAGLLRRLPCRGPVDLWINHHFSSLRVLAVTSPLLTQRCDTSSTNSYSILPALTTIGAITSEVAAQFCIRPNREPVFAFWSRGVRPFVSGNGTMHARLQML